MEQVYCLWIVIAVVREDSFLNKQFLKLLFCLIIRKSRQGESTHAEPSDEKFSTPTAKADSHVFLKPADPKPVSESEIKTTSEVAEKPAGDESDKKQSVEKSVIVITIDFYNNYSPQTPIDDNLINASSIVHLIFT